MLKWLGIFLVFILSFNALAQEMTYRDSLKETLSNQENEKQFLYDLIGRETKHYRQAVNYNQLGLLYQYESQLDSAHFCHQHALKYAYASNQYNQEIGVSYNKIGVVYYYKGQLDSAIIFFKEAIPFYQDQKLKANSYNNLAIMYKYNSNSDKAIENYLSAHDIFKEIGDTLKQVWVLNNIGALYNDLESYKNGEYYINKGLELCVNDGFLEAEISLNSNLANIYNNQTKYDLAIPIFMKVIDYYKTTNNVEYVIVNQNNLAESYDGIGQKAKALNLFKSTLDLMTTSGVENNKEAILINLASCYEESGDYNDALKNYIKAKNFAIDNDKIFRLESIYEHLANIHQKLNNSDSSIYYKDLQIALKDSLDNVEKELKMMELEAKHKSNSLNNDLKQTKDTLLETKRNNAVLSKTVTYALLGTFIFLVIAIVVYFGYKNKSKLSKELEIQSHKDSESIEELKSNLEFKQEKGKLPYPKHLDGLTTREKEVLIGVQDGLKDKEIADRLFISITTVRTHLRKAYVKIDVRNRAEAIKFISEYEI